MKRILLLLLFNCFAASIWAQDYVAIGDSCFKVQNYTCAGKNYDLFLEKVESRSNMIAYRAAKSWSLAGDKERAFIDIQKYVTNNYLNNYTIFSNELIKEKSFDSLKGEPRWKEILTEVLAREAKIKNKNKAKLDSLVAYQAQLEHSSIINHLNLKDESAMAIYKKIRGHQNFPQISKELISMQFRFTDSLHTAYLVVLPKDYRPDKKYPILFFLHGAVKMNTGYPDYADARDTSGWNRYYTKYASLNKVIMVYPSGNRDYNWMTPDKGFYMIPVILANLKGIFNIDDNKVFLSGHSNGATGSFSYAMKQPSAFAGFYGFNTRPQVATGGTFIRNLLNRSFFNVSTDQDYYYPPAAHDTLTKLMMALGADYQDHRYNGFPHWFPAFKESEPAFQLLFTDLLERSRKPFQPGLQWECDDVKYGRCDWIGITQLDTLKQNADWQKQVNFKIDKWIVLDQKDEAVVRDTSLQAFKYPKRSGAIKARYAGNIFHIETSRVKSLRLYFSPEMINFEKKITIYVNGKIYFSGLIKYNKDFIIDDFMKYRDRIAVWANFMDISI